MKTYIRYILILSIMVASIEVFSQQGKNAGRYESKIECLGMEMDGSVTMKAWGTGRNRFDAVDQANKNALRNILFDSNVQCADYNVRPLIAEVNAYRKHQDFFNEFFDDSGGSYKDFVSSKDERIVRRIFRNFGGNRKNSSRVFEVIVRVDRAKLKKYLESNGIIKTE